MPRLLDLRDILRVPAIYSLLQRLAIGKGKIIFAEEYVRAREDDRILDVGCGPGNLLAVPGLIRDIAAVQGHQSPAGLEHQPGNLEKSHSFIVV